MRQKEKGAALLLLAHEAVGAGEGAEHLSQNHCHRRCCYSPPQTRSEARIHSHSYRRPPPPWPRTRPPQR